jgi:alkylation response protein AidB-like acyl-CoA dehydrogenase
LTASNLTHRYGLSAREIETREWGAQLASELPGDDLQWDESAEFPWKTLQALAEQGVLGLTYPTAFGGRDGSRMEAVLVQEQLAATSFAIAEAVHVALNGPAYAIAKLGQAELAAEWVPRVIAGQSLISIAITEFDAGTALGDMTTTFTRDSDGGVRVDGHKCFVTAGALADALLVVGRFGGSGLRGLGAVLVDKHSPGVVVESDWMKMGGNAIPEVAVRFDGCVMPARNVLIDGDAESTDGLRRTLHMYDALRLGIAGICLGVAQGSIDRAVTHLRDRRQAGRPLSDHQGLRWRFARLALELEQARLLTYRAARMVDADGFPPATETAMAKLAASEVAVAAADAAIQALGWRGMVRSQEHPAERVYREARGWSIAGGTTESALNSIARDLFGR